MPQCFSEPTAVADLIKQPQIAAGSKVLSSGNHGKIDKAQDAEAVICRYQYKIRIFLNQVVPVITWITCPAPSVGAAVEKPMTVFPSVGPDAFVHTFSESQSSPCR